MEKAKISQRPKCSCGSPMKNFLYKGYYDEFQYWECSNSNCNIQADNFTPDTSWRGAYS